MVGGTAGVSDSSTRDSTQGSGHQGCTVEELHVGEWRDHSVALLVMRIPLGDTACSRGGGRGPLRYTRVEATASAGGQSSRPQCSPPQPAVMTPNVPAYRYEPPRVLSVQWKDRFTAVNPLKI